MSTEVDIFGIGKLLERLIASLLQTEDDKLLRMGHRHRAQEKAINYAKDGCVDGDAESESRDGKGSKARRLAKYAKRIAQIVPEAFHRITSLDRL